MAVVEFVRTSDSMEIYQIISNGARVGYIHCDDRPAFLVTLDANPSANVWCNTLDDAFTMAQTMVTVPMMKDDWPEVIE